MRGGSTVWVCAAAAVPEGWCALLHLPAAHMADPHQLRAPSPSTHLLCSGKAMAPKAGDLLDLVRDILLTARLDDRARFTQVCVCVCVCVCHRGWWGCWVG